MKFLCWSYENGVWRSKEVGDSQYTPYDIRELANSDYMVRYNSIGVYPVRIYKTLDEAKDVALKLYNLNN